MKNLLVVGGTGFIGYHIIAEAKRRGYKIYSISLNNPKKIRIHKSVKYIKVDISNFNQLKKKLKIDFNYVVNAGGYGIHPNFGKDGDKLIKNHFFGLINILQVLNLKKIKKFVHLGSSAEYGNNYAPFKENYKCTPNTPYAIAKLLCTNYLLDLYQDKKFPVTVLRLFQVYGPKQDDNRIVPFIINSCLKNKKFPTTKGSQLNDFCYIDDVIKAIFKSFNSNKSNGEIINVGSGKPIQIKKIINMIKKLIGKGKPMFGSLKYRKGTNMKNYPNIQKAKILLAWNPKIKINTGLKKTITSVL